MATFEYTNLAPYQQVAAEQLLAQSRRNPLEEMIAAYQAPRIAQQKALSDQLALEIQRANLQATQRGMDPNSPENKLKMAIDQAKLAELTRDPNIAFQQGLQEEALKGIITGRNPNLIIEPTIDPAILATRSEAEAAGGIPSTSYKQSDFIPLIPASRGLPAMGTSQSAAQAVADRKLQNEIAILNARAEANGVPVEYFTDVYGNLQSRPKRVYGGAPSGTSGGAAPILDAEGNPVQEKPKPGKGGAGGKPIPRSDSEQLTGLGIMTRRLDEIEKSPKKVRKSNVGWMDNILGAIQASTGIGTASSIDQNSTFRTAVDSLVGEFSFGRGGKSLTVGEKEVLDKYLPTLTRSNADFESRLKSFRSLINEMKESRLQTLEDSGFNVDKFRARDENTPDSIAAPKTAEEYTRPVR